MRVCLIKKRFKEYRDWHFGFLAVQGAVKRNPGIKKTLKNPSPLLMAGNKGSEVFSIGLASFSALISGSVEGQSR